MGRLSTSDGKLNLNEAVILVAGENQIEVDVLIQILSGFGARHLRRGETIAQAQSLLDKEPVDLLLLDMAMGPEACVGLAHGLRRTPGEKRFTPVVVTTAHPSPSLVQQAIDSGINFVVSKPLTPQVLFERLLWVAREVRGFVECASFVGPDRRVRSLGPPAGMDGRRADDLPPEVGEAVTPNMSQEDIDAMLNPTRKMR